MIVKIVSIFIVLNQVLSQDHVLEQNMTVLSVTEDVPKTDVKLEPSPNTDAPKKDVDLESVPNVDVHKQDSDLETLPNPTPSHEVLPSNDPPPVVQEQADQPPEDIPIGPGRLPSAETTSLPSVHKDEETTVEVLTTIKEITTTQATKPPREVEKQTTVLHTTTKKPDAKKPEAKKPDATHGSKENKNGAALFTGSLILMSSACMFRFLN